MRIEPFLPSRHGFAFTSTVELDEPRFGLAVPVAPAFGLSAGMAWAALDRYHAGRPVPAVAELPPVGDALRAELVLRQGAALGRAGWAELREWQSLPEHGWPWAPGLADRTRAEWRRLRRRLDAGEPVMLYLVLARGRHANPSSHQAVLAYGYETDRRSGRVSVRVYDPSRPGNDGVRLVFRVRGGFRSLDARLAVQTPVRGFFCVPYDRPLPARLRRSDAGTLDTQHAATILAVNGSPRTEGALSVLARSEEGRLLQIRRGRRDRWTVSPVQASGKGEALVEDAAAIGPGHLIVRTPAGELVEARRRAPLGWRMRSISGKAVKTPFDATPVVLRDRKGNLDVLACRGGRLMHFRRGQLNAWRTTHVKAGPLARAKTTGMPAAAWLSRDALHVVVRTESGELIHARWRGKQGWSAENVTARSGDRARFLLDGDPLLLGDAKGGQLNAVGRSRAGAIVLFRWTQRGGWKAQDLSAIAPGALLPSLSPVTATVDEDGTVHAVGRTDAGGLLHAWCTRDGAAGVQDVTHSRAAIGASGEIDGGPQVFAAPGGGLHVFARRGAALLLYRWDGAGDWSVEDVSAEHAGPAGTADPVLAAAQGTLHGAVIDQTGRLHHVAVASRTPGGPARVLGGAIADAAALPLTAVLLLADLVLLPVRSLARVPQASDHGSHTADQPEREKTVAAISSTPHNAQHVVSDEVGRIDVADVAPTPPTHVADDEPELLSLPESADSVELIGEPVEPLPLLEVAASADAPATPVCDLPEWDASDDVPALELAAEDSAYAGPVEDGAHAASAEPPADAALAVDAGGDDAWDLPQPEPSCERPTDDLPPDEPMDLPLLEPSSTEDSWTEPWSADDAGAPAEEEPEPWKTPAEPVEPWLLTPLADEPWMATPGGVEASEAAAPDLPPELVSPLPELTAEPAVEPAATAATPAEAAAEQLAAAADPPASAPGSSPDVDDWSMPPLSVEDDWNAPAVPVDTSDADGNESALPLAAAGGTTDDWNEAPAADATTQPTPAVPQQPDRTSAHNEWNFPPLESAERAPPVAPAPRKWSNPALAGLPLLDDEEPAPRPAAASKPPAPAPKPEPEPQANGGKKKKNRKKSDGADELQRVMALADQNRPELLPPS